MNVTLSIPDELWEAYKSSRPLLVKQLERFKEIEVGERILIFRGSDLARLEKVLGLPGISPGEVVAAVEKLGALDLENAKIVLKPGQRKRIQGEADHYKETFAMRCEKLVGSAIDQVLGVY